MADQEMELVLSEQTIKEVQQFAAKNNQSEEEVLEFILREFISNQYHVIEKRAQEVNEPVEKLVDIQIGKIANYLATQKKAE
jgi:cytochrome c553